MTRQSVCISTAVRAEVQELPPSAKLVFKILEYEGDLTQSQLIEETLLPERTVRYAVTELEKCGAITAKFSFRDARKRVYSLRDDTQTMSTDDL